MVRPLVVRGGSQRRRLKSYRKTTGYRNKPSPSEKEIDVAVYQMKKNIIALLHHNVLSENLEKQHIDFVQKENCPGASGNKM